MAGEPVNKTWFVDVDGTILHHHTNDSLDKLIEEYGDDSFKYEQPIVSAVEFFQDLPETDIIVIATAREKRHTDHTLNVLEYIISDDSVLNYIISCYSILFYLNVSYIQT